MDVEIGSIVEGKVTGITKFGAFVSLPMGRSGMVHISEVAHSYVSDIHEHLTVGQEVKVKIMAVDKEGRINLSIKKAAPPPAGVSKAPRGNFGARPRPENLTFEDKLRQFMQDSQTKMSGMRPVERRAPRRDGRH
ncbi:MAG: S1 RNA-binding domain-containing protein [Oscillospiraceae bacterium]|jgi:S1 RNA binding domain protein|nr:S1 RNA-binding domain-containing protein [Oscillospiraceae bacterium]